MSTKTPRLLFHEHPELVTAPFAFPAEREAPIVRHPNRTLNLFIRPRDFLDLTNTPEEVLSEKRESMRRLYLDIGRQMVQGEVPAAFPVPFLKISHLKGRMRVTDHEGRHRALMAMELGMPSIPVVFYLPYDTEGYEHQSRSIESDPLVVKVTNGDGFTLWSQSWRQWGQDFGDGGRPLYIEPMSPRTAVAPR